MRHCQPPPLPPVRRLYALPWWAKPAGVLLLAVVSAVLGAVALPALRRPAPKPSEPEVETAVPVVWRTAVAASPEPEEKPSPPAIAFDRPAVAPRLPSATGVYALSAVIDREIGKALRDAQVPASPTAGDAEFYRRVHLDLIGRIPSAAATREFLATDDPLKRSKVVDELLASPEHGRYLARLWADLLVKRDADTNKNLKTGPFINWLSARLHEGATWDRVVTEMICAEGEEGEKPETFFVAANQDNNQPSPAKLTGAVGNLFLGVQVQCAECHRHPYYEKWSQDDFWGMAAFFGQTRIDRGAGKAAKKGAPGTVREEAAAKGAKGAPAGLRISVPDPNDPRKMVKTASGKFLDSKDAVPAGKGPYRPALARWVTSKDNPYFAKAAVNRFWSHLFARGLIDPIEEMQNATKVTHPELLDALAEGFRDSGHDLRFLFRAICNSETYQRTSRPLTGNEADETKYSRMPVKVMNAWQLVDSLGAVNGTRFKAGLAIAKRVAEAKSPTGTGGDAVVRGLDTREVDDPATEFTYGIPQVLKLMNTPLTAASANQAARIVREHPDDVAGGLEECFLMTLSRRPRPEEVERLSRYVAARGPEKGYAGVLWALLNSAEFLSNH